MTDRTLRELQTTLPWSIRYSRDFRANPQPHKDFAHAMVHVGKAAGKLLGLIDDMDHDREVADDPTLREQHAKYLADLVICALRAANTFPGGVIDLQAAVEDRIAEKNVPRDTMPVPPEPDDRQVPIYGREGEIVAHTMRTTAELAAHLQHIQRVSDAMHPGGRCTCFGEGSCALCIGFATQLEEAEREQRVLTESELEGERGRQASSAEPA